MSRSPQSLRSPRLLSPQRSPGHSLTSPPQLPASHAYSSSSTSSNISSARSQSVDLLDELERLVKSKMGWSTMRDASEVDNSMAMSWSQTRDDASVKSDSSGVTSDSSLSGKYGHGVTKTFRPCLIDFKEELKKNEFPLGLKTAIEDGCRSLYRAVSAVTQRRGSDASGFISPTSLNSDHQSLIGHNFYFEELDKAYTMLMPVALDSKTKHDPLPRSERNDYVGEIDSLLKRLPVHPRQLPSDMLSRIGSSRPRLGNLTSVSEWSKLDIVRVPATREVRLASLKTLRSEIEIKPNILPYINASAHLINEALKHLLSSPKQDENYWLVVITFLWSSWQRATMLHLHSLLDGNLRRGFNPTSQARLLRLQAVNLFKGVEKIDLEGDKPDDICNWAWLVLRNDSALVPQDFRYFLEVYRQSATTFGRCIDHSSCHGSSPHFCNRAENPPRGQHITACASQTCARITWDRESWHAVGRTAHEDDTSADVEIECVDEELAYIALNSRAVCLALQSNKLCYTAVTSSTIAFSHVTAHGREGSPDDGIPRCWHEQCAAISTELGGKSYWIDNSCIPGEEEHQPVRKKIIDEINDIFSTSKAVVICDKDLMDIDIPGDLDLDKLDSKAIDLPAQNPNVRLLELIVARFIVSDWNMRAWPLLEGIRGKQNLQLLFARNKVLSLASVLKVVCRHARLDLAILGLTLRHLLPWKKPRALDYAHLAPRHVPAREATKLLSYRSARRYGDRRIIQTLLEGRTPSSFFGSPTYRRSNAFSWFQNAKTLVEINKWLVKSNTGNGIKRNEPLLVVNALPAVISTSDRPRDGEEDFISWAPELPQTYLSFDDSQLHLRMAFSGRQKRREESPEFQNIAHVMVNWNALLIDGDDSAESLSGQSQDVLELFQKARELYKKCVILFPNGSFELSHMCKVGICGYNGRREVIAGQLKDSERTFLDENFWHWLGVRSWNTQMQSRPCTMQHVIFLPDKQEHGRYEPLSIPPRVSRALRRNDFRGIFDEVPERMQPFDSFRVHYEQSPSRFDMDITSSIQIETYQSVVVQHFLEDDMIRTDVGAPRWEEFVQVEKLNDLIIGPDEVPNFIQALKNLQHSAENSSFRNNMELTAIIKEAEVMIEVWQDTNVTAEGNLHKLDTYPRTPFLESTAEMDDESASVKNAYHKLLAVLETHKGKYQKKHERLHNEPDDALDTLLVSMLHLKHKSEHRRTQMQECLRYWYQWKLSVVQGTSLPYDDVHALFDNASIIILSKLCRREKATRRLGGRIIQLVQPRPKYDRDFTAQCRAVLNIMVALRILIPPTYTAASQTPPPLSQSQTLKLRGEKLAKESENMLLEGQTEADYDEHSENGSEARTVIGDRQRSPITELNYSPSPHRDLRSSRSNGEEARPFSPTSLLPLVPHSPTPTVIHDNLLQQPPPRIFLPVPTPTVIHDNLLQQPPPRVLLPAPTRTTIPAPAWEANYADRKLSRGQLKKRQDKRHKFCQDNACFRDRETGEYYREVSMEKL